jgi:hypothetical protein
MMLMALALAAVQTQPADPMNNSTPEAVRAMHDFAGCIVREHTGEARAVLAMDFRTRARTRRMQELARSTPRCVRHNWIGMNGLLFAGSLAEQLYLRDHRSADPVTLVSAASLEERSRSETLGNCVVRHSPAAARAVLDTPATSEAEGTALDALRPAIAACLQGADEARLNRPGLRALVALSLYHAGRLHTAVR